MGRLPWFMAMGMGPLAAMLLVAHERAPLVAALADASQAHGNRAVEQVALKRARLSVGCNTCTEADRGEVDLAYARAYEADGRLDEAIESYSNARQELGGHLARREQLEAMDGLGRARAERARSAEEERLAKLVRKAKEEEAIKDEAEPPSLPPTVLVGRAEAALSENDADAAAEALDGLDDSELSSDPALQLRAIRAEAGLESLQHDPALEDDFQRAVKLELGSLGAAWSDPPATLRLWARAEGKSPTPALVQALNEAIEACTKAKDEHAGTRVARIQLILGETLVAQGNALAAVPVLTTALNLLTWSRTSDSAQTTRDLLVLANLEEEEGNYQAAYSHYLVGVNQLDKEVTPIRERSQAWRKVGSLVSRLVKHKNRWNEADLDYQRALGAVMNDLEPNDPEVLDDRLALAESKLNVGDKEGAQVQLAAITAAVPKGEQQARLVAMMRRLGAHSPMEGAAILNTAPKSR